MAENIVVFRDNQELQADDFTNMQSWMGASLDHVVLDTIDSGSAYSGFAVTKSAATQVSVAPGRLYTAGAVYAQPSPVVLDLYNDLPITTQKYFAIVVSGQTIDQDIQPRNFLIDADTGQAEPQSVAMETTRYCNVNYVRGSEGATPQFPNVDVSVTVIAYVLTDPTGILSVQQNIPTQVDNLTLVAARVTVLEAWRAILAGMVDTLRTDLANLAAQLLLYTPLATFQNLVNVVSKLETRLTIVEGKVAKLSDIFIFGGRDSFLDTSNSDTDGTLDGVAYSAFVSEGLRFKPASTWTGALQLLNPSEPMVLTADGVSIPKPSGSRVRYDCSFPDFPWLEHRILQYCTYNPSLNFHHLRPSRWRHRCGPHFDPCPPSQLMQFESHRDSVKDNFEFDGDNWDEHDWEEVSEHDENDPHWPRHSCERNKYFWRDWCHIPYWDKVYTDYPHSGNHMAQSFFNAQDGWLTSITVFVTKPNYGDLNIFVSGCDAQGVPDHENHTLRRLTLLAADVQKCAGTPIYAGDIQAEQIITEEHLGHTVFDTLYYKVPVYITPIRIPIQPVFLRAGQRYAFHLESTFDHYFASCDRDDAYQVHQGHLWHNDGQRLICWPVNAGPMSLRFMLHFATFSRWGDQTSPGGQLRYEIGLQSLLLSGGIGSIDVTAESIIPDACDVSYQVQVGNVWEPFATDPLTPSFAGPPTQLPFRVVMTGTTDLMPGISFANSEVDLLGAPTTAFHWYSEPIACSSCSAIKIIMRLRNFAAPNTLVSGVRYNGSTTVTPGTVADSTDTDSVVTRTVTFTVSAATSYQVELHGAVNGGNNFIVESIAWYNQAT